MASSHRRFGFVHLRTKLIVILVSTLGVACLFMGVSSYLTLKNSLTDQVISQLDEASHRSASFKYDPMAGSGQGANAPVSAEISADDEGGCQHTQYKNPLNAPGQAAGTITLCVENNQPIFSGVLDAEGNAQSLSDSDITRLKTFTSEQAQELHLDAGEYLVQAQSNASGAVVITGLPLADTNKTLTVLIAVMLGGSLVVMVLAGWLGSWIIRRTMKPLERVSGVATGVAHLDLETDTISNSVRVLPKDSDPSSEVGAVGYALNQLLDNVHSALTARQRTEDQMRSFVADASHELRTPLAAIRGYSDLLKMTEPLGESGERSLSRIDSQTLRMGRLVEDLLLLARLDEGRQPQLQDVDLTELLVENVSDLQVAAPDHVWKLDLPDEPIEVRGDPAQLQQVLINLLSNARKHTEAGTTVTAGLGISVDGQHALMTVEDNGGGIAPDFVGKIFDRFARADRARSGSDGTTGLGLAIVKAIVEAHGGSIEVASRPGRTRFSVYLPLEQVRA